MKEGRKVEGTKEGRKGRREEAGTKEGREGGRERTTSVTGPNAEGGGF